MSRQVATRLLLPPVDPVSPLEATTKQYVDSVATSNWNSAGAVVAVMPALRPEGQTVSGSTAYWSATFSAVAGRRYRIVVTIRAYSGGGFRLVGGIGNTVSAPGMDAYSETPSALDGRTYEWLYTASVSATQTLVIDILPTSGAPVVYATQGWIQDVGPVSPIPPVSPDVPWLPMIFYNGWGQYSGWEAAEYRKVGTRVEIKGLLDGTAATFGGPTQMPEGYRPPQNVLAMGYISDQIGTIKGAQRVNIQTDGVVLLDHTQWGVTFPCDFLSLHGISWYTAA